VNAPSAPRRSGLLVVGLVAVVAAVVAGLVAVQRVGTTYEDGLAVAGDSAALAVDAVDPLRSITTDLVAFAAVAEVGVADARNVLASARDSLDQLGAAAQAELATTTEGVASVAADIAGVVERFEDLIPGNRDSVAEDLRQIADNLEPVPAELRRLGVQLQATADELGAALPTLDELDITIADLGDALAGLEPAIDDLSTTADLLAARVDDASNRVGTDLWLVRLVVVLIGVVLAVALLLTDRRTHART